MLRLNLVTHRLELAADPLESPTPTTWRVYK